jgi:protein required for attachment to host cells
MPDKIFEEKKKFINQVTKDLDRQVVGLSEQLLKVIIQEFVDKLDRNGDVILNNSKNLKLIAAIDKVYQKFMGQVGGGIAKRIADGSSRIMGFNNDYYSQFKKTEAAYKNSTAAVEKIINDRLGIGDKVKLVENGYLDSLLKDNAAKNLIKNLSFREVLKGSGFKGFKRGLERLIVGDEQRLGAFRQHYSNYAYDVFVQVDANSSSMLAKDIGLKHFIYEGTLVEESRDFCRKRAGEVFTLDEAAEWKNDPWIKQAFEKEYITSYDPVVDRGLWRCRHLVRFISKEVAEMLRPDLKK